MFTLSELKDLQKNSDWLGIYEKVKPISALKTNSVVWDNDEILSVISFATAKLSEVTINLNWTFKNEDDKKQFLIQQKSYRKDTNILRQRCIELKPNFASYYSNIAYSHYQYVRELTVPGGRRDGNPKEEAEHALKFLDKALELEPSRINDLYRKGQLLAEMLPKVLIYNKATLSDKDKAKLASAEAKLIIDKGIESFEKAVSIYESYPIDNKNRKRYYKEYVKSLYDLSRAYTDMVDKDWDETVYALKLNENISVNDKITYIPKHLEFINKAISNIKKCIIADNIPAMSHNQKRLLEVAKHKGQFEGVYKLYSLGKIFFIKYWILSGYGQRTNEEADNCRELSIEYLNAALVFDWSNEKEKQDKAFIAERIARVLISKKDYEGSINILETFFNRKKRPDYYVFYTMSLAYIKKGDYSRAQNLLNEAISNKGNKEVWLGHFLLACSKLSDGKYDEASKDIEKATQIAEQSGKYNLDSLLIAKSFIHYKEKDKYNAVKYLEEANKINPYRASITTYIDRWKSKPSE